MSIYCPGNVSTSVTGVPICSDGSGNAVAWVSTVDFDVSQLDGPSLAACYGIGFTIIGMSWFIGKAVGSVLKAVKNI